MVLRVQPVSAPAAGRDWTYTVPGQYLMDVKAVQATLATPFGTTTIVDSSGNSLNATLSSAGNKLTWGAPGPYGGGANDYALKGNVAGTTGGPQILTPSSALLGTNPTSVDALVWLNTDTTGVEQGLVYRQTGGTNELQIVFKSNGHDPADLRVNVGIFGTDLALGFLPRNAWHHVAVTTDGTNFRAYLDGVLKATVAITNPPNGTTPTYFVAAGSRPFNGLVAAVAVYGAQLNVGQIAAHVAAEGTNAAYKAAVLADTPAGLWMLDDTGNMGSRKATLEVTNGTTTLADFPGGAITGVAGSYTWTWASQAPGTSQSADATINLVQIPDLILPAGYTIGTVTPDLGLADSWTNINIWWDDGEIGPGGPVGPYEFPPSVHLVYQQRPPSQ